MRQSDYRPCRNTCRSDDDGAAGRLAKSGEREAVISGQDLEFHQSFSSRGDGARSDQAARRYSASEANTRAGSKAAPERYQPQIIFTILRPTAVMAFLPGIFWMPVLW